MNLGEGWHTKRHMALDFLIFCVPSSCTGEAIYAALFDAAPSLQSLFKTPRQLGPNIISMLFTAAEEQTMQWLSDFSVYLLVLLVILGIARALHVWRALRSVMAMRFMNGLNSIMNALHTPTALKAPKIQQGAEISPGPFGLKLRSWWRL